MGLRPPLKEKTTYLRSPPTPGKAPKQKAKQAKKKKIKKKLNKKLLNNSQINFYTRKLINTIKV